MLHQLFTNACEDLAEMNSTVQISQLLQPAVERLCIEQYHVAEFHVDHGNSLYDASEQRNIIADTLDPKIKSRLIDEQTHDLLSSQFRGEYPLLPKFWSTTNNRWETFRSISDAAFAKQNENRKNSALALFCRQSAQTYALLVVTEPKIKSESDVAIFHSFGLRLFNKISALQERPTNTVLSRNERYCLVWGACGKTSSEIAIILSLSEHTVNHYFTIAATKLGANNRTHATAKAIQLGLIGYDEIR